MRRRGRKAFRHRLIQGRVLRLGQTRRPKDQTDRQMVPDLGYRKRTRNRDEDKKGEFPAW